MACTNPSIGIVNGYDPNTGRNHVSVVKYSDEILDLCRNTEAKYFLVPCGKCLSCRLDYSRQWANRMLLELQYHDSAYFVTLTYSDDFLPKNWSYDFENKCSVLTPSLKKEHMSRFLKHVRKHFKNDRIRFFGSGEYGSHTFRPHYHIILFGLHLNDLVEYKRTSQGNILYTSDELSNCWSNFYGYDSSGSPRYDKIGYVVVSPVTWETCAYVARYTAKKATFELESKIDTLNIEVPFSLSSRRPGIGFQWFEDHPDCLEYDFINVKTKDKGIKFRPPKYYRNLARKNDIKDICLSDICLEDKKDMLISNALLSEIQMEKFYETTDAFLETFQGNYSSYLSEKDFNLKSRTKLLDRSEI